MTDNSKTDNRSQADVFPSVSKAIGSINGDDRIKTLIYAFKKALEAGKAECSKDFNAKPPLTLLNMEACNYAGHKSKLPGNWF